MRLLAPAIVSLFATGCLINGDLYDELKKDFDTAVGADTGDAPPGCDVVLGVNDQNVDEHQFLGNLGRGGANGIDHQVPFVVCGYQEGLMSANWFDFSVPYDGIARVRLEVIGDANVAFQIGMDDLGGSPDAIGEQGVRKIDARSVSLSYPMRAGIAVESWVWHWGTWPEGTDDFGPHDRHPEPDELQSVGPAVWYRYTIEDIVPAPTAGSLVITEVYPDQFEGGPAPVTRGWFEVWNPSNDPNDILSLEFVTVGPTALERADATELWGIRGGAYAVIGPKGSPGVGFEIQDEGFNFGIPSPLVLSFRNTIIDATMHTGGLNWMAPPPETSLMVRPTLETATNNDVPENWCNHGLDLATSLNNSPGKQNPGQCADFR